MSGDILIELIDTLGNLIQNIELFLLNFTPGFNVFIGSIFVVSIISLMFYLVAKSFDFTVIGTK